MERVSLLYDLPELFPFTDAIVCIFDPMSIPNPSPSHRA